VSPFIKISSPVKRLNVYLHDLKDTYILLFIVIKFNILVSNMSDAACSTSSDHNVHGSLPVMVGPGRPFELWSTAFHEIFHSPSLLVAHVRNCAEIS
jgi:hypothetical protein